MAKGRQPILQPALEKVFGDKWKEEFSALCTNSSELIRLEDATSKVNTALGLSLSPAAIYSHAVKIGIKFKVGKRGRQASTEPKPPKEPKAPKEPKIGGTGKKGKPSTVLPALLVYFETEDALKSALENLAGEKIKDVTKAINKIAGTNLSDSNIYSMMKKFEIGASYKRKLNSEVNIPSSDSSVPDGVELPKRSLFEIPVKFICTHKGCSHSFGQATDMRMGLALKARKCPECGSWASYKGMFRKPDGSVATIILKDVDGIVTEVEDDTVIEAPIECEDDSETSDYLETTLKDRREARSLQRETAENDN